MLMPLWILSALMAVFLVPSWANSGNAPARARVVAAYHPDATEAFKPRASIISNMVAKAIVQLTGTSNATAAWRSLVGTQDTVGIKVYRAPGPNSGTRPEVAAAVVEGLLSAGHACAKDHRVGQTPGGFAASRVILNWRSVTGFAWKAARNSVTTRRIL